MWRGLLLAIVLAGCTQLPPSRQDIEAKRFETAPGKAVVYIVRDIPDFSDRPATIWLDDAATITTYPGTYHRWEVAPGAHRISGFAGDAGLITLEAEAGRVYFVRQTLSPWLRFPPQSSFFPVNADSGEAAVRRSSLIP